MANPQQWRFIERLNTKLRTWLPARNPNFTMNILVNPFKKHHVDHTEDVRVSLENAERFSSFITAHNQRIADDSAIIMDKTVEAGTQTNNVLSADTVEGLRAEIDQGMLIDCSLQQFQRLILPEIEASGHDTVYDRKCFHLGWILCPTLTFDSKESQKQ